MKPDETSSSTNGVARGAAGRIAWFCVHTHPKHEHIAAQHLLEMWRLEVFNPKIRSRRPTTRGPVWFTESLFPGYIFARFVLSQHLDPVKYCPSVSNVVRFGTGYPVVPDSAIEELRRMFGPEELLVASSTIAKGDTVRIVGGAFHDLLAVVKSVSPEKHRVQALLEFLGTTAVVDLAMDGFVVEDNQSSVGRRIPNLNNR